MCTFAKRIAHDEGGATIVEFALIAPAFVLTIMALFEFSYNYYAETMIEGAVQKAARDSTIEAFANNPAALDTKVRGAVQNIVPSATVTMTRSGYRNYSDMNRAEEWTDTNGDGVCADNEPFEDINGNGVWDSTRALDSASGARDAVLYQVDATYDRAFPMPELLGWEQTVTVTARTVLRNQPFNATEHIVTVGNCA
ncbi:TadE/TadG family type IV pilus assembly protein [Aurantiacibacter sediminis]|uniref:Pilus assembly protein n=1 Tax=Aurantiacibacter sediminis TaxID=2793064 RepID=A0ABS0N3Y5_9SPHN|nr:TadE/TadG family type IV pilus assembly protein [Aurantiacibacter sediminis]MBH5322685.1 pilus assembly protein [Aurantiacibacter sediminis]